ncbi:MAG: efflux RND transporter permease subunit, partial [Pseudomonadota bacterium]
ELKTAAVVKEFIAEYSRDIPDGVTIDVWVDRAHYLQDRLDMMLNNMFQGAILVFLVLTLFLRLKVAQWVIIGIPIAFFGALALMPHGPWPVTISIISLFALILVLGIVVDDAIIIAESVYTKIRADGHTTDNVVAGAQRVATAATFGVLTTIAAFVPMLFIGGLFAPFFEALSVVVALCLVFSLVESKLILPAHLAETHIAPINEDEIFSPYRGSPRARISKFFQRVQRHFQHWLQNVIQQRYKPALELALRNRGVTVAVFATTFMITIGLIGGGLTRIVLFPEVPGDYIQMDMTVENGTPPAVRNALLLEVEDALFRVVDEYDEANPETIRPVRHIATFTNGDARGTIVVELPLDESRPLDVFQVTEMWRDAVPELPGVKTLNFNDGDNLGGGKPISLAFSGDDYPSLMAVSDAMAARLAEYEGLFDIETTAASAGDEIQLAVKPGAEALGISLALLGRQVRQAFYGEEAQRIQRGKDEVKVMVRYPDEQRRSVADLRDMRIRTASGAEVPFDDVAEVTFGDAFTEIERLDRKRTVTVSADLDPLVVQTGPILEELMDEVIPEVLARYPSVSAAKLAILASRIKSCSS